MRVQFPFLLDTICVIKTGLHLTRTDLNNKDAKNKMKYIRRQTAKHSEVRDENMLSFIDKMRYLIAVSGSYSMRRLFPDRFRGYKLSFPSMARLRWRGGLSFIHPRYCADSSPHECSLRGIPLLRPPKQTENYNKCKTYRDKWK